MYVRSSYTSPAKIWSTDVADKWLAKTRAQSGGGPTANKGLTTLVPTRAHQHILRACNLQAALAEALSIDPDIAFKGSRCTPGLKIESQRRLTMVFRALLALCKAFVSGEPANQALMFKHMDLIVALATPPELVKNTVRTSFC